MKKNNFPTMKDVDTILETPVSTLYLYARKKRAFMLITMWTSAFIGASFSTSNLVNAAVAATVVVAIIVVVDILFFLRKYKKGVKALQKAKKMQEQK